MAETGRGRGRDGERQVWNVKWTVKKIGAKGKVEKGDDQPIFPQLSYRAWLREAMEEVTEVECEMDAARKGGRERKRGGRRQYTNMLSAAVLLLSLRLCHTGEENGEEKGRGGYTGGNFSLKTLSRISLSSFKG